MSPSRLRVGVVGAGMIVENAHLPVLLGNSAIDVRWVADLNISRTSLLSKMFGVRRRSLSDFDALLEDVDACLLAIPVGARTPYIDACAKKEKALLAEKPFAVSAAQHQEVCGRFAPYALGASFQRRFYASIAAARHIVRSQPFGPLESISFGIGGFDLKSGGPKRYLGDPRMSGGGITIELGIHALDQVLVGTDATAVTVDSVRSISLDGIDYDVLADSMLQIGSTQVPVHCELSRLRPVRSGFRFVFERSTVSFGLGPEALLTASPRCGGAALELTVPTGGATTINQAFSMLWAEFIDGLQRKKQTPASAATSLLTSQWVDQIYAKVAT